MSATEKKTPPLGWLYVYLTRKCNLECVHCWLEAGAGEDEPDLKAEQVLNTAHQALPLGLQEVRLTGGEPTISPEFERLLDGLAEMDVRVHIESNVMAVTEKMAERLGSMKSSVAVSVDGDAEFHDEMRAVKGAYNRTMEKMKLLAQHQVPLSIVMALRKSNVDLIEHVRGVAKSFGMSEIKINPAMPMGRAAKLDDLLSAKELLELNQCYLGDEYKDPAVCFDLPAAFFPLSKLRRTMRCQYDQTLSILADGRLALCGLGFDREDWRLEQAEGMDVETLWNESPVLERIREEIPAKLEGVCGRCMLKEHCRGGCRALSLSVYGSWLEVNPKCKELYDDGLFPESRLRPA